MTQIDTPLPELIERWQRGWAASRGFDPATPVPGGLLVDIRLPHRQTELISLTPDDLDSVRALAEQAAAADVPVWLTVMTHLPVEVDRIMRAAGLSTLPDESLMGTDLSTHPHPGLPDGYTLDVTVERDVVTAVVLHSSGASAARGYLAVVGTDGIADMISTEPAHQRRGLGRAVMGALAEAGRGLGATTGLLLASPQGRELYASLGWRLCSRAVVGKPVAGSYSAPAG
ncbi:GNAT family N-acetyltransferase [Actinokineospora enzanensis]|uniref:GNAT family N-acetyltransferase n=1 Tax=Actinokineospora enzanensis TaxID=155975 RepID=UPI00035D6311|nr:GNAT family N-acetyltransferase [Actinokineospora enzanensis]